MNYTSTVDARDMPGRSTSGANNDRATTDMIQRRLYQQALVREAEQQAAKKSD